jgi:hypothetical protein
LNVSDSNLLYSQDLFYIHVKSVGIAPVLSYVQTQQGIGSVFSSYTIGAGNYTFVISNINGTFGKITERFIFLFN